MRSRRVFVASAISLATLGAGGFGVTRAVGADQPRTPVQLDETARQAGYENYMDWVADCLRDRGANAAYDTKTGTLSFDPRADDSDDLLPCIRDLAARSKAPAAP